MREIRGGIHIIEVISNFVLGIFLFNSAFFCYIFTMIYKLQFKPLAIKELKKINRIDQKRIITKIEMMSNNLTGDIKKLTNFTPEYRLRVGNYRILFEILDNNIIIYTIKHRKDIYK